MKASYGNSELKEIRRVSANRSFVMFEYTDTAPLRIAPHWHNSIEILYCLTGSCIVENDEMRYQLEAGEIVYIPSSLIHSIVSEPLSRMVFLQISSIWLHEVIPEFFKNTIFLCSSVPCSPSKLLQYQSFIQHFMLLKDAFFSDGRYKECAVNGYVFLLIYKMLSEFSVGAGAISEHMFKYQTRVQEISEYVNHHYTEDIRLEDLADRMGVSSPYLSKIFKKYFLMNFKDYLVKFRLERALYEMQTTNKSLLEISEDCGFASQHAFIYSFKKQYGQTPGAYKKQQKS